MIENKNVSKQQRAYLKMRAFIIRKKKKKNIKKNVETQNFASPHGH